MNDEELKQILKDDHSAPKRPVNEWSHILKNIEAGKEKKEWKLLIPSCAVLILVVIVSVRGVELYQEKQDREIAEFLYDASLVLVEEENDDDDDIY